MTIERRPINTERLTALLGATAIISIFWFIPGGAYVALAVNACLLLGISLCQLYAALLPSYTPVARRLEHTPFVSVHIPIYNEPPEIVQEALNCLKSLNYPNFEVIVLDNNTKDEHIWRPVADFCDHLGERFRFRHIANLTGAKAGALNVCLDMSDSRSEYILVLDADYCVDTELLNMALTYFVDDEVALVQFPQAYSNADASNAGLSDEYAHFFDIYMNMANHLGSVLSTGTVSVLRKTALEKIGGWSSASITEDVELSLQLMGAGYRGVYVAKPLGHGLMPTDEDGLKKQRQRWVYGNAQTLLHFFKMDKSALSWQQRLGVVTQLTAWFNFTLLPLLALGLATAFYAAMSSDVYLHIVRLSLVTLLVNLSFKSALFVLGHRGSWRRALAAFGTHLGLMGEGSSAWLLCLLGGRLEFKRTNKFLSANRKGSGWLLLTSLLGLCALVLAFQGAWTQSLLSLCALALPLGSLVLARQLEATHTASIPIYRNLKRKWRS